MRNDTDGFSSIETCHERRAYDDGNHSCETEAGMCRELLCWCCSLCPPWIWPVGSERAGQPGGGKGAPGKMRLFYLPACLPLGWARLLSQAAVSKGLWMYPNISHHLLELLAESLQHQPKKWSHSQATQSSSSFLCKLVLGAAPHSPVNATIVPISAERSSFCVPLTPPSTMLYQ